MNATHLAVIPIALLLFGCSKDSNVGPNSSVEADELLQAQITLPPGFQINVFAPGITRPRSMVVGDNGTVFVGSYFFTKGVTSPVYALRDEDGDGFAEFRREIWNGFNTPNGLAFHDGTLWIVDEDRVWRIDNVEETLDNPQPRLIYSGLPSRAETDQATNVGHWWRYMTYGPDDKLYISVGTRWSFLVGEHTANDLNDRPVFSSIVRMSPTGEELEIFADGVRNSMGMAFHPVTGDLWFTDNGPSWPFEHPETYDIPADELDRATQPAQHFGFPYIHASLLDPLIGNIAPEGIVRPAHEFQAHTAPLGIKFYTGTMFPEEYRNQAFIAEHGTEATTPVFGVRSRVHGDRIALARFDEAGDFVSYEAFATGFLRDLNSNYNRRPVDLVVMPDGALLVSDDQAQTIYRISYTEN